VGEYEIENKRPMKKHAWGLQIYSTYLRSGARLELNLSQREKRRILEFLNAQENINACFRDAKQEVIRMLQESYNAFSKSQLFKDMKKDIKGKSGLLCLVCPLGLMPCVYI
jgi:hypothetical protein